MFVPKQTLPNETIIMASKPVTIPENPTIVPFVPQIGPSRSYSSSGGSGLVINSGWVAKTGHIGVQYVRRYFDPMMPPEDIPPTTVIPPGGILFPTMQLLSQPTIAYNLDPSPPENYMVPAQSGWVGAYPGSTRLGTSTALALRG